MKAQDFVHLHCHSMYSLLEALPSPEEVVERAAELEQTAVGLADKGYTYGLIEFYKAAKAKKLKPILGVETYIAARTRHDKESGTDTKRYPITLLARNQEGYLNLLQLSTKAALEGMYYKPRVDHELLKMHGAGLIALTGPIGGAIPQAALAEDGARIQELTELYWSFFGKENVYYELMDLPNVSGQAEVNQQLIHWGKKLGVPVVATCNSHYCRPQDAEAHDVQLCIQKNSLIDDPSRFSMRDSDFSMRPFAEMEQAFAHCPEALENTRVIADRCDIALDFGTYHIPRFPVPTKATEADYLREQCYEGFRKRYPNPTEEHKARVEYELSIINQLGFSGYFLIVWDFIREAKSRGIIVGPGRGSAAGSMVSYCLDITTIDPIEHGLLFERFLNPERVSMPDVDVDFADNRRDEVLQYVREKYGSEHVVQICTFGTLAARAAVKDVGRAYGVPFLEMNALAKMIPDKPGTELREALEMSEMKTAYDSNPTYRKIIDTALKLEGKTRHVSVHACGVIITQEPTAHYTALQRAPKDENIIITQSSAKPLEALGLLKMDFLGLMNLTVIQSTLQTIERMHGTVIDLATLPLEDKTTFALLQKGDTTGVFQLESPGMRRYLKQLKPTNFGDITAMVALYRPGPMEWIPGYVKRKNGLEAVSFVHDDLRPILEPTFGIGIYQEQILQIAQVFAGYSLGEADLLRRAIGKKIKEELDAQREKFIAGAVAKGYQKKLAEKIFDDVITPFAGYGFNKSHAAGYARIAYETAYLKANYPTEFMAALLSADSDDSDRIMIEIEEARHMGIAVLPPDINESNEQFTPIVEGGNRSIRFGLSAIKGVGEGSVQEILAVRGEGKFTSIEDFAKRVPSKLLNKKLLESLAKAGALDSLGERRQLVENMPRISEYAKVAGDKNQSQNDLFAGLEESHSASIDFPTTVPATHLEKLLWEKEALGMYVSSHPLAGIRKYIRKKANLISTLTGKDVKSKVTVAGLVESIRKMTTKKGEAMAILTVEDPTGKIDVTLFPRTFADFADQLEKPDSVLVIGGTLDARSGVLELRADAIKRVSLSGMVQKAKEQGFYDEEEAKTAVSLVRPMQHAEAEVVEMVDEEGNVVAGEVLPPTEVPVAPADAPTTVPEAPSFHGPLAKWMGAGMPLQEPLAALGWKPEGVDTPAAQAEPQREISLHTVELPERAPKKLLLELKAVLELFPGSERIQLSIGGKHIPLPLTVSMSPVLESKLEKLLAEYR